MGDYKPADILTRFSLPSSNFDLRPLKQGYINDTFLLIREGKTEFILQRINTDVFPNPGELMHNIEQVLPYLNHPAYASIQLIPTLTGESYYQHDEFGSWRVLEFIPGSVAYDITSDPSIASEAGRLIGTFHILLRELKPSLLKVTIPGFHHLEKRLGEFDKACEEATEAAMERAATGIGFVNEHQKVFKELVNPDLPLRVCHNDTKLNNMLFASGSGKGQCLIDLDTLMPGYFLYDFGDAVRTVANTAAEDETDLERITFSRHLFSAFIQGMGTSGRFLSRQELKNLHLGAAYMPFLHGIRALTDYLNGNLYYQVAYEEQNLHRALSLFKFTGEALEQLPFMKACIEKKLEPMPE